MDVKLSSASNSLTGSNGYSADSERTRLVTSLPVSISLRDDEPKKPLVQFSSGNESLKRDPDLDLEINRQYLAKRAKEYILLSEKDIPTSKLHDLLPAGVLLTIEAVKHIYSSSVPDATHLHNISPTPTIYDDSSTLASLVESCRHAYAGSLTINAIKQDSSVSKNSREDSREGSASSVTDTESSTSDDGPKEVNRETFLEDGKPPEPSSFARLILSSNFPFTIVHANTVFESLVNFALTRVLGHNIDHFLAGDSLTTALQDCATNQCCTTIENQRLRIKPTGKGPKSYVCKVHISTHGLPKPFSTYLSVLIVPDEKQPQESLPDAGSALSEAPSERNPTESDDFESMSLEEHTKIMG